MPAKKATAPSALKIKVCSKEIRVKGNVIKCGKEYLGADTNCPNRDVHLSKYPTGHCQVGSHEGVKNLSASGKPMLPCKFFVTCPCKCHADLDKLFSMADMDRVYVDESGYQTPPREYWLPSDEPDDVSSSGAVSDPPRTHEEPSYGASAVAVAPSYAATPTGRAARGELESWVHDAVQVWLVEQDGLCTPAYVAKEIAKAQAVDSSVGAIDAVFKRWVTLGFALMEKKPTRLTGLTERGKEIGLTKIKLEAKRQRQQQRAEQRRGTLR